MKRKIYFTVNFSAQLSLNMQVWLYLKKKLANILSHYHLAQNGWKVMRFLMPFLHISNVHKVARTLTCFTRFPSPPNLVIDKTSWLLAWKPFIWLQKTFSLSKQGWSWTRCKYLIVSAPAWHELLLHKFNRDVGVIRPGTESICGFGCGCWNCENQQDALKKCYLAERQLYPSPRWASWWRRCGPGWALPAAQER